MSTGNKNRKRLKRVTSVAHATPWWEHLLGYLKRGDVLQRLALCVIAAVSMWAMTRGWSPPRTFRLGQVPERNVFPRVEFSKVDVPATLKKKEDTMRRVTLVFKNDTAELEKLRANLQHDIQQLLAAESFEKVDKNIWDSFQEPPPETPPAVNEEEDATPKPTDAEAYQKFKEVMAAEGAQDKFKLAVDAAILQLKEQGILLKLPQELRESLNSQTIKVRSSEGQPERDVQVEDTLKAADTLQTKLKEKMPSPEISEMVFRWFKPNLVETLSLDFEATKKARDRAADEVEDVLRIYKPYAKDDPITPIEFESLQGNILAEAGKEIKQEQIDLLELEYQALLESRSTWQRIQRSMAVFGMHIALFTLCGFFIYYRDPSIIYSLRKLITLLVLVLTIVGASLILAESLEGWMTELSPLLIFGMIAAIAYKQELAVLFSAAVVLIVTIGAGHRLSGALVLLASTSVAILLLQQVRSRSKLLIVGFAAAFAASLTAVGVGALSDQPFFPTLLVLAGRAALWAAIAGSLMTCLLPVIEKIFGVQTDISLIELGDPAHPLLQELIRRAPGTYNHSITVASLAEAAAESIGARGLLVRVGAYFHDIGKMLKPGYFIENQMQGDNRHESLVPAMSTLVIIAHVKDGADLARQHHLPESIIDFIQQHHGTTLVEYFYRRANQQQAEGGGESVDEATFRYPGPKPQSKEAAILMIADAVESASRVLVEPTPSRIENLVNELTMKRLLDGQFDDCDLTLEEVRRIGDSLVKSLTAVYHGRVKYSDTESA